MILDPFQPYWAEATTYVSVTGSAATVTGANNGAISPSGKCKAYRFCNNGTSAINFIAYPNGATVTAVTVTTGVQMLPGTVETFTLPPNMTLSVIGAGATTLSVTPGEGA